MLGLRRHTVQVMPHDPAWVDRFRAAQRRIAEATRIPADKIQHVGSTAVCDFPAKPIVDIDVAITASDKVEEIAMRLVQAGFIDRGQKEGGIGRLLVWETAPEVRTIHIHVIAVGSQWWRRDLAFRDALQADAALYGRYGRLKIQLAQRFSAERNAYRHARLRSLTRSSNR